MRAILFVLVGVLSSTSLYGQQAGVNGAADGRARLLADNEKLIHQIRNATDPVEAAQAYGKLFDRIGIEGVRSLQTHPNDSIALQAAWEEVALTVPDERKAKAIQAGRPWHPLRPDQRKADWFLGFLQGRTRVQPPKWWADLLVHPSASHRRSIFFDLPENDTFPETPYKSLYHDAGLDGVVAPPDTTLRREGDKIVLTVGKESATVPELIFADHQADRDWPIWGLSALITPQRCYIALHYVIGGYPLVCIDRRSAKVLWKSRVWGAYRGALGGHAEQWVAVTEQNDRVVVFGCNFGINVEAFRSSDGTNLFRFSNSYLEP